MPDVEQILLDNGYEGVVYFTDFSYDTVFIGVTTNNRAVYDFELMVEWLIATEGFTYEEAVEWIDYNTIRSLPYGGPLGPIVMYRIYPD